MYKILITNQDTEEIVLKATTISAEGVVDILSRVIRLRTEDDAMEKLDSDIDEIIDGPAPKKKHKKRATEKTNGGGCEEAIEVLDLQPRGTQCLHMPSEYARELQLRARKGKRNADGDAARR